MSSSSRCMHCQCKLPKQRAEFLSSSGRPMVCVKCSAETPTMVLMEYGHKTAGYAVIIPRGDQHKALRCYRRSR
jgi:hypothetical protein